MGNDNPKTAGPERQGRHTNGPHCSISPRTRLGCTMALRIPGFSRRAPTNSAHTAAASGVDKVRGGLNHAVPSQQRKLTGLHTAVYIITLVTSGDGRSFSDSTDGRGGEDNPTRKRDPASLTHGIITHHRVTD